MYFSTRFFLMRILTWNHCICIKYLFYWYEKFCSCNILVTDDTGNVQGLKSAFITSNSIFPILFLMRNGKFKWIQLKSYCRYHYNSFFKLKYIMCTSKRFLGLSIFSLHHYLKQWRKPTPKKHFSVQHVVFWNLYRVSKKAGRVFGVAYIKTISSQQKQKLGVSFRSWIHNCKNQCPTPKL